MSAPPDPDPVLPADDPEDGDGQGSRPGGWGETGYQQPVRTDWDHVSLIAATFEAERRGDAAERRRTLILHYGRFHRSTKAALVLVDLGIEAADLTPEERQTLHWPAYSPPERRYAEGIEVRRRE